MQILSKLPDFLCPYVLGSCTNRTTATRIAQTMSNLGFLRLGCLLRVILRFVLLALARGLLAADSPNDALNSLVQAEKDFAQMSMEKGMREAFLANLADDGIVFDPGPLNGKTVYAKRAASDGQLTWQPIFADVAFAGDLGYTTGPWEYKKNRADEKPSAYGQFFSIWKRQNDGKWKLVLDGGVDNAAPINKQAPVEISPNELASRVPIDLKTARRTLAAAEKEFDAASAADAGAALIDAAARNIRVFRNGRFPAVGREAAQLMIGYDHGKLKAKRTGGGISRSGDFAYSYGDYTNERLDGIERGHFVTVWRMSIGGEWKLAVDVRKQDPPAPKRE
jgi:ketosteroid isomerase-like protein